MPRYFLDLPDGHTPIAWDPRAGPRPERADTRYFGSAFLAMEQLLEDDELDVYLTWNVDRLPSYGERVLAVVLGDEAGRIPRYADRVRAVFKCYGTRPTLGSPILGAGGLAQWAYRWARWLPGGAIHLWCGVRRRRVGGDRQRMFTIPVGTFNQLDLPVRGIAERSTDVFFAGSVQHRGAAHRLTAPKERARREMLAAAGQLERRRPQLRLDLRLTQDFTGSASSSAEQYSRALMDSKVCLAPRGTSLETFRVFEGLRYGCVVVSEHLPKRWYYDGAPILRLRRWSELERVLWPVISEPAVLERWHRRTLEWWRERCSEVALGGYMAACLNEP
jgi:hypothetical protein